MLKEAFEALRQSERPVLIFGAGARSAAGHALELARVLGAPVAPTWGARDLFPEDCGVLCAGGFGTHGTRAANFTVQNADWILSVGSRLDSKATGTPRHYFARGARIFMVDIDPAEIAKFRGQLGREFQGAQADAGLFLRDALTYTRGVRALNFTPWRLRVLQWLERYPARPLDCEDEEGVNPYALVRRLSDACGPDDVVVSDTGLALAWMMQAFGFKAGQTFVHALNQTPMGYGLPAAIGAAFARPDKRVVLVNGDGGLMLNIQELPLLVNHRLPVKIVLFNNAGHAMCRQTQDQWLGGRYYSTSLDHGLAMPNFRALARTLGLGAWRVNKNADVAAALAKAFKWEGPALIEFVVDGGHRLVPQVPYGMPNEDGSPRLSREELREQMIVGTVE